MFITIALAAWHSGGLSVIYAWCMVYTLWVKRPLWVNQPGQLSLPSLRGR